MDKFLILKSDNTSSFTLAVTIVVPNKSYKTNAEIQKGKSQRLGILEP